MTAHQSRPAPSGAGPVAVLTGAGISAESGVPTFRDALTGLWARFQPAELATPEAFQQDPQLVWEWYRERRRQVAAVAPNPAHHAIAALEAQLPETLLVTQNVDGLHQRAGSRNVVELHGNILRSKCSVSHRPISAEWLLDAAGEPPPSPYVRGAFARPDVVWFGETLPQAAFDSAVRIAGNCTFCFSVGTTSLVQPAAGLPLLAARNGAALVEINPQETPLSRQSDQCIRAPASMALAAIADQVRAQGG